MAFRKVYVNNGSLTDVSDTVVELGTVVAEAPEYGQVLIAPAPELNGWASFWDPSRASSPLYGASAAIPLPVQITNADVTVFTGAVLSTATDGPAKRTRVTLQSRIQKIVNGSINYQTSAVAGETPATAFYNICVQYGIPFDNPSVSRAISLYTTDSILIRIYQTQGTMTIVDIFNALAEIGVARIYELNGTLAFDVWSVKNPSANAVTFTLSDDAGASQPIRSRPSTSLIEKQPIDGYVAQWEGDITGASASYSGTSQRTIAGGGDSPVIITTRAAANWIGVRWMSYLNRPQRRIEVAVPVALGRVLSLGWPYALNYSGWEAIEYLDLVRLDTTQLPEAFIAGTTW